MGFSSVGSKSRPPRRSSVLVRLEVAHPHDHRVRVVGRRELRDPARQRVDEELGRIGLVSGQLGDPRASPVSVTRSGWTSAIGCTAIKLLMMNSMRASPTPAAGKPPPAEGRGGAGDVEHEPRARGGDARSRRPRPRSYGRIPAVHVAFLTLGAGHRDHLRPSSSTCRSVAGADHGRHAELAADDRGVAGRTAMVGDDPGCALHDRHPVGVGHLGDEDRAVDGTGRSPRRRG